MNLDSNPVICEAPEDHTWDVVVVGAGAGGATAGFALARQGRSVLFLERGKLLHQDPEVVKGQAFSWNGDGAAALRFGWHPQSPHDPAGGGQIAVGSGSGGTTAVFGKVMDRFRPEDFEPRRFHPRANGSSLPDAWPISYEELAPYYKQAEALYRVRGTGDPLLSESGALLEPPAPSQKEQNVTNALEACGLHPYRIHYALEKVPGCTGCGAMLCPRDCRNDAGKICLRPALEQHGARILPECRVTRLEEENRRVHSAVCDWRGRSIVVKGRIFVIAANAFFTPVLLLRSANERFPQGLANDSGMVGRNLMLHVSDWLLLRLKKSAYGSAAEMNHGVAFNDFYVHDGAKLGTIQAHAVRVTHDSVLAFIRMHKRRLSRLPDPILSLVARLGEFMYRPSTVFATILEDLPYAHNRVTLGRGAGDDAVYEYRYPDELRHRSRVMFDALAKKVASHFKIRPLRALGMLNGSHGCGTCRFGTDPRTSVLDRDNRAHALDNLYVVDASFFPSSGGINPSLTITANSLRVAERISERL